MPLTPTPEIQKPGTPTGPWRLRDHRAEIYRRRCAGERIKDLAAEYGCSPTAIHGAIGSYLRELAKKGQGLIVTSQYGAAVPRASLVWISAQSFGRSGLPSN